MVRHNFEKTGLDQGTDVGAAAEAAVRLLRHPPHPLMGPGGRAGGGEQSPVPSAQRGKRRPPAAGSRAGPGIPLPALGRDGAGPFRPVAPGGTLPPGHSQAAPPEGPGGQGLSGGGLAGPVRRAGALRQRPAPAGNDEKFSPRRRMAGRPPRPPAAGGRSGPLSPPP